MKFTLVPEYKFEKFDDVTPEFLLSLGIRGVLLDIDNTIEPYEHSVPGEHVCAWLNSLKSVGINAAFVSNNKSDRVDTFNKDLGIPAYSMACKPLPQKLYNAMLDIGTDKSNTVFIGDQILTDVLAAHNAGIIAILVSPINDKRDLFTRFKRWLEKPIHRKFDKIRKENK